MNTTTTKINGVDVEALGQTREAIKNQNEIAQFQFRASNKFVSGGLNRSAIKTFTGALQEHRTDAKEFAVMNDEPHVLLSGDQAPNPAEYAIQALLGCMTTTTAYHAAGMGIEIEAMRSEIEADVDLRGMLNLDPDVRPGFQEIRAKLHIKTKGSADQIRNLHRLSPMFDSLARPVPVKVEVTFED